MSNTPGELTGQSGRTGVGRIRGAPRARIAAVALATAAALGALAIPAVPGRGGGRSTPSATPGKVSFVLGIKQDIDSLNPYVGVVASAYEAYQLMYDYLTARATRTSRRRRAWPRAGIPPQTARPGPTTSARA